MKIEKTTELMMTELQIQKIYTAANNQKRKEFLELVKNLPESARIMFCNFYRLVAQNNLNFSLIAEEHQIFNPREEKYWELDYMESE